MRRALDRPFRHVVVRRDVQDLIELSNSEAFVEFVRNVVEFDSFDTLAQRQKGSQRSARQEPDPSHIQNQRPTLILFDKFQNLPVERIDTGCVADPAISEGNCSHFARLQYPQIFGSAGTFKQKTRIANGSGGPCIVIVKYVCVHAITPECPCESKATNSRHQQTAVTVRGDVNDDCEKSIEVERERDVTPECKS